MVSVLYSGIILLFSPYLFIIFHKAFLICFKYIAVANLLFLRLLYQKTIIVAFGSVPQLRYKYIHIIEIEIRYKNKNKKGNGEFKGVSLTYLAVISIFVIDNCMKTIGVHDRVFDVNDKVENSLEPAG